ncbi:MAG: MBL fold metallo-hydrolase [Burkholderiales bacterium]|nr:MBL fold metallo-hydrolase [Burkholderiales bacterium]MDE2277815.1 MBL fold metallo-hydrolase [Burkholderiales bacterium]
MSAPFLHPDPALQGLTVLERGWLSSNNVLLHGDGSGAVLVDSSHALHAGQTLALVRRALRGEPLRQVVNTHLHSDHCGGNASLQRAFGCRLTIPPGQWDAVLAWDEGALSYAATGQHCERFVPDDRLASGEVLAVGGRQWQALAAPGHDPHSLILFDPEHRVVITADALWQRGFGVVFPELEGEPGWDDVARVLDLIESLGARWAIPGHGRPFDDVPAALAVARQRLAAFRADPQRHAHHAMKALIKYHLLEVQQQPLPALLHWFDAGPLYRETWQRAGRPAGSMRDWGDRIVAELAAAGVLALRDGVVYNA